MNIVYIVNLLIIIVTCRRRRITHAVAWTKPTLNDYGLIVLRG